MARQNQTNALRLTEMAPTQERAAIRDTVACIEGASGKRPMGWQGAGLAETWSTLDHLADAGICYVCDWRMTTSPICSKSATRRWCRCTIR